MTVDEVEQAILASGGRIVYSTTLDEHGRNVGSLRRGERGEHGRKVRHCGGCGARDHDARRCRGPGQPPAPIATRHR